ncbi:MAG: nucleoside deaminase [Planctomycetota bacterium]|nr:nucleoside deaminase [Planctomycetota bacterium]
MFDDLDAERMLQALRAASEAFAAGEVPVGAVVYRGGRLIARAHNQRETLRDPTAHAEMLAITQAAAETGDWRLEGCVMYATLEPCAMCAGALILARLPRLVYAAADPKAGACGSVLDVTGCKKLNHAVKIESGLMAEASRRLLHDFFQARRPGSRKS